MDTINKMIQGNKSWSEKKLLEDPDYFENLSKLQTPEILWIGCSDSRVPANQITKTHPGEIFVHRNIANMVVKNDKNLSCVLEFAVKYLKIKHVIVCGHYECGGVIASTEDKNLGIIEDWVKEIREEYQISKNLIKDLDKNDQANLLAKLNVINQLQNLANHEIISNAWQNKSNLEIHGWIYNLKNGLIEKLLTLDSKSNNNQSMILKKELIAKNLL